MKNLNGWAATGYLLIFIIICVQFSCQNKSESTGATASRENTPVAALYEDNFIGEWKSQESEGRSRMVITRNGENFIIQEGEKAVPGIYNKEKRIINFNVGMPLDIMYIEDKNMLLISGGGYYSKVIKKE